MLWRHPGVAPVAWPSDREAVQFGHLPKDLLQNSSGSYLVLKYSGLLGSRTLYVDVHRKILDCATGSKRRIFLDLAHLTEELFTFRPATVLQNAAKSLAPGAADRSKLLTKRSFRQNPGRVKATSPAFPQMAISHSFAVTGPAWRSRHKPPNNRSGRSRSASRRPSGADRPDRARTASPATPVSARRAASARAARLLRCLGGLGLLLQARQQLGGQGLEARILVLACRGAVERQRLVQGLRLRLGVAPGELHAVQRCQAVEHGAVLE